MNEGKFKKSKNKSILGFSQTRIFLNFIFLALEKAKRVQLLNFKPELQNVETNSATKTFAANI